MGALAGKNKPSSENGNVRFKTERATRNRGKALSLQGFHSLRVVEITFLHAIRVHRSTLTLMKIGL
jgi:hypothetical protein